MKKTVTIRLPEDLYEKLTKLAKGEKRTISGEIEVLILKGLDKK